MSKFVSTSYLSSKEILKFPKHFVAVGVTVSDSGITANSDGKKIVPAGTIVGGTGGANAVLANNTVAVTEHNTQAGATGTAGAGVDAEGVLLEDVDVTYGSNNGSMVIHGFIGLDSLPSAPCADAVTALKGRIVFMK